MSYMETIFLWLGKTSKNQEAFDDYFKIDYSEDENTRKICGFCNDIGKTWYDEDFIGYILFDQEMSVRNVLKEVPISLDDIDKVLGRCEELNIESVNSVYWYSGEIETPSDDKNYNELLYIGKYNFV